MCKGEMDIRLFHKKRPLCQQALEVPYLSCLLLCVVVYCYPFLKYVSLNSHQNYLTCFHFLTRSSSSFILLSMQSGFTLYLKMETSKAVSTKTFKDEVDYKE